MWTKQSIVDAVTEKLKLFFTAFGDKPKTKGFEFQRQKSPIWVCDRKWGQCVTVTNTMHLDTIMESNTHNHIPSLKIHLKLQNPKAFIKDTNHSQSYDEHAMWARLVKNNKKVKRNWIIFHVRIIRWMKNKKKCRETEVITSLTQPFVFLIINREIWS